MRVAGWINHFFTNVIQLKLLVDELEIFDRASKRSSKWRENLDKQKSKSSRRLSKSVFLTKNRHLRQQASSQQEYFTKDYAKALRGIPSIKHAPAIFRWFARWDEVSNHPSKELHRCQVNWEVSPWDGGSRDESELYIESFARKVLCSSRTTAIKELYGMQKAIQGLSGKTADGNITQFSIIGYSETVCQLCNRFGGTFLHCATTRQTTDEALYLCLFVCLQTHCCHLEIATSLS